MDKPQTYFESFHSKQGAIVRSVLRGENAILVSGRGFGKSIAGRGVVTLSAIDYKGFVPPQGKTKLFNVIAGPHLNQLKKIHWEPLEYLFTETVLSRLVKNINRAEAIITLKGNRPGIMLAGLNDDGGAKIRGFSIPRLQIDEFQDVKPGIWASIKPAVDRCGGCVFVTGTPKGKGTGFHKFTEDMVARFGWKHHHYLTKDNPKIPNLAKVLEEAKAGLTEREYRQEYEASWEDFPGQIYDCLEERHIISLEYSPNGYDFCVLGIDWGDINPAISIIGIKAETIPYKYYLLETWEPNADGGTSSVPFDIVKAKCLELATKYNIHSTYPDVFQPGNHNYIYELRQLPHPGLQRIVEPQTEDYARMRSLRIMPSCAQVNRLFKGDRFFLNRNEQGAVNQVRSMRRKQDRDGNLLDEPDPSCREHINDTIRYCISNIENALVITYGFGEQYYSPFAA